MTTSAQAPATTPFLFAPFAGSICQPDGQLVATLIARHDRIAITSTGELVGIDRPCEWLTDQFTSWYALPLDSLNADSMRNALNLVEMLFALPAGTLSADSLPAALKTAAAAVNFTLAGFQQRLAITSPSPM